jgi:spore germination cell wall hydrolase CwlJ-like protein
LSEPWIIGGRTLDQGTRRRVLAGAALSIVVVVPLVLAFGFARPIERQAATSPAAARVAVQLDLPRPDLLRPLTSGEAVEENAKRTFSERADTPAASFRLRTNPLSGERAIECLTQAIYYEAGGEGLDGGRAVAQVVLNRVRHPAYPSSICGVVYQGSDRATGCQFTFTCDGSLARVPSSFLWRQARRIAIEALAGKVYAPVGHATHYHADFVLPYWADSLDKSVTIGRHIFYRLKGSLGSGSTFRQRYAGTEPIPPPPTTTEVASEAIGNADELSSPIGEDPGAGDRPGELPGVTSPRAQLLADTLQGTLIIDEGSMAVTKSGPRARETCPSSDKQHRPLAADDLRAQSSKPGC